MKTVSVLNSKPRARITLRSSSIVRRGFLSGILRAPRSRRLLQSPFRHPSRRPTDANAHPVVSEVDTLGQVEGRRVTEANHFPIATDQFRGELRRWKIQQVVPFIDKRPASILIGLPRMRDLGPFDQCRITTNLPRDQPMHDQLRGVANYSLVNCVHGSNHLYGSHRKLHRDRSLMMTINGILPGSLPSRSREALVNGVSAAGAVPTRDVLCPGFAVLPVTRRKRAQTISDRWRSLGDQQYPVQQQLYASKSRINANAAGAA